MQTFSPVIYDGQHNGTICLLCEFYLVIQSSKRAKRGKKTMVAENVDPPCLVSCLFMIVVHSVGERVVSDRFATLLLDTFRKKSQTGFFTFALARMSSIPCQNNKCNVLTAKIRTAKMPKILICHIPPLFLSFCFARFRKYE